MIRTICVDKKCIGNGCKHCVIVDYDTRCGNAILSHDQIADLIDAYRLEPKYSHDIHKYHHKKHKCTIS